jgi:PhnB protein
MPKSVRPVPDGYHSVIPYLIVNDAARAIDFYEGVFGAREITRFMQPDGRVGHAELRIGDSVVMLADEAPDIGARSPRSIGGTPVTISVYVEDVDATVDRAVEAGAQLIRPVEDQFYGDRAGGLIDPFGHSWHVATHVEDVPEDEMRRRAAAQHAGA